MSEEIQNEKSGKSPWQPLYYSFVLIVGILIGTLLADKNLFSIKTGAENNPNKLVSLIDYIEDNYVDSVDKKKIIEDAIASILKNLDPHSYYLNPEQFAQAHEEMMGSYQGVGIEFLILRDSLMVNKVVPFGPSFMAGLKAGDRIVQVNGENISGATLNNDRVMKLLKGDAGSHVNLTINRKATTLQFDVERNALPVTSIPAFYKIGSQTAYIKIERFAKTTYDEFINAANILKNQGCTEFVLDLRGNGGGLLEQAVSIAEEFLPQNKLIVYTEGLHNSRKDYITKKTGAYTNEKVIVLIDEASASASEILAGAIQDWDRGLIVGRRSFGKGLVQNEIELPDHSALRLTVARYYTPTGRCIQKPYNDSTDYYLETHNRWLSGEMYNTTNIHFPDSLKKYTAGGRVVYGGGGIFPDVFIPFDSTSTSYELYDIVNSGVLRDVCFDYVDKHRDNYNKWKSADSFVANYTSEEPILSLIKEEAINKKILSSKAKGFKNNKLISLRIKAQLARTLFDETTMFKVLNKEDNELEQALKVLENYNSLLGK